MLPHSRARRPAATNIACSIDVVVVLPLVPVTTSQRRGGPYRPALARCQANSTSPQIGTPAAAAAASTGAVGGRPGLVTTRSKSVIFSAALAASITATPFCAYVVRADGLSSVSVARAPSGVSAARMARPVTLAPVTRTAAPERSTSCSDGGQPLAVEERDTETAGDRRKEPEPDDDRGFCPADEFEVVMERCHPEPPAPGGAERHDLHDDRGHLRDEQRTEHD